MPINDNLAIQIRAVDGQTDITDAIAGLVVGTGSGTVAQMEDATYGRFWRLTGGAKSAVLSGMGEWMKANSTTIAMRFRISNRAANYTRFAIMGSTTDSGLMIGNGGTTKGGLRVGVQIAGSNVGSVGPAAYTAGTLMTAVLRFAEGATDAYDAWYNTVDRVETDPNNSATSTTASAYRGRVLLQFLTATETLDIFDFDMWTRGVTNAEGAALADDIRGTLYGSGTTDATAPGATLTGTATLTPGSATGDAATVDATAPGTTLTGTATLTPGTATAASAGVFVSDISINNTGSVMASTVCRWQWNQGEGIGVAPTSVTYGTGTTDADGRLTVTGLPTGAGELMYATPDYVNVCYQRGTVT